MPIHAMHETAFVGDCVEQRARPKTNTSVLPAGWLKSVAVWIDRSRQRRALHELVADGRLLSDIGVTREEALREAAKPFWRR
jgi:uncharacterized protein YjiS (DUF1127 family)